MPPLVTKHFGKEIFAKTQQYDDLATSVTVSHHACFGLCLYLAGINCSTLRASRPILKGGYQSGDLRRCRQGDFFRQFQS
jgi:hypothetical protein